MNIFNKVALQGLLKNRTRTIVTIIGVILSAALITAVSTFAVSLQNYMINGSIEKYGNWHLSYTDATESFVNEQKSNDKVSDVFTYNNIGYALLKGGKNPNKPYIFVAGFNDDTFNKLPVNMISGRLPKNENEAIIPTHVSTNGGVNYSIGDKVSLSVGTRTNGKDILNQHNAFSSENESLNSTKEKQYTIVGIYQRPSFEEYSAPGYTLITKSSKESVVKSTSAFITLKNPKTLHSYLKETAKSNSYFLNDDVLRFMGLSDNNTFNTLLYSVGGILIALIMLGSVFLIYNSFTISLNDRMRQFGILLSVGATEKQLKNSVLFEGLCIGAVGIPLGILLGIPSIKLILALVNKNFSNVLYVNVPLDLKVSGLAIIAAAVISLITILISAYIPAKKAASTPVMECIRQTNEIKVESKAVKTNKVSERIYGLTGTLALKNFKRNKRRYRSIVLSLVLSVVLFICSSAFSTELKRAAGQTSIDNDYDICFYTHDMPDDQLLKLHDQLKTAHGVTKSSYQANTTYTTSLSTDKLSDKYKEVAGYKETDKTTDISVDVQFIEDNVYYDFVKEQGLNKEDYVGEDEKYLVAAVGKTSNDAIDTTSELISMLKDKSIDITLNEPKKDVSLTVVDIIPVDALPRQDVNPLPYTFVIVAPFHAKAALTAPNVSMETGLTFSSNSPTQSTKEMQSMIDNAGVTTQYTLYNLYEIFEQNRNISFVVNLFTIVFVIMISLIAVANVFNTISTNIRLRKRELAMLRSVGMSDHDFNKMMRFECALYGIRTLLFGLPISILLSYLIHKGITIGETGINFIFPWASVGISIVGVFLIIFVTMIYAVNKIKKENIIDALRDDMT